MGIIQKLDEKFDSERFKGGEEKVAPKWAAGLISCCSNNRLKFGNFFVGFHEVRV